MGRGSENIHDFGIHRRLMPNNRAVGLRPGRCDGVLSTFSQQVRHRLHELSKEHDQQGNRRRRRCSDRTWIP